MYIIQILMAFLQNGLLVQLVRTPACHAGGRWFKSSTGRQNK